MFKIGTISIIALLLIGCGPEKNPAVKSSIFQSVDSQSAILVQEGSDRESCGRCGMNLVKFYKTSHSAIHNGVKHQYCSMHCLLDHLADGINLDDPQVVDVNSLKFIDIREAHYVVGSNMRGTMTQISKYAFSTEGYARDFQDKYGGEIMDFYKALEIAKSDFK